MTRYRAMALLTFLLIAAPIRARAGAPTDGMESALALLGACGRSAVTREAWSRVADVDRVLIAIAEDRAHLDGIRSRALDALGTVGGERAIAYLDGLLYTAKAPSSLLAAASRALVEASAGARSDATLAAIAPHLEHPDWLVRRAAVLAIARLPMPAAREALAARLGKEHHAAVSTVLAATLAR